MNRLPLACAFGVALVAAQPAVAAPCKTEGAKDAKELTFNLADKEVVRGMQLAFRFGLEPAEFPASDISKITAPCSRGVLAGIPLELFGEDTDMPPRWASAAGARNLVIYVAALPQPQAAAAWADAGSHAGADGAVSFKGQMMVAVVLSGGDDKRMIFAFFDKIPDDDRLKALMQTIAAGKAHWLAGFNVNSRAVTPNTAP